MYKLARSLLLATSLLGLSKLESIAQTQNDGLGKDLIGYWNFDQSAGNVVDSSGLYHTLVNNNSSYGLGKINNCGVMGDGKSFNTSGNDFVFGTNNFTISLWFKSQGTGSRIGFMCNNVSWLNSYAWRLAAHESFSGRLGFFTNSGVMSTPNNVLDDNWHAIAIVREGTGANQTKMYLDGNMVANYTCPDNFTSSNLYFGDDGFPDVKGVTNMDEVGIWKRALNSLEVSAVYNNSKCLPYPFYTLPVLKVSKGQLSQGGPQINISISSPLTNSLTLQETHSLDSSSWKDIFTYTPSSTSPTTFSFPLGNSNNFYRVMTQP